VANSKLGANYFDERRRHYTVDRLARRIEHLGYRVHLEPVTTSVACEIFKAAVMPRAGTTSHVNGDRGTEIYKAARKGL
jgi:hypothetical protein